MKKKYKLIIAALLVLIIIILLLGFLFLHKTDSTGNNVKSETTKTSKTDTKKDVSDSKYTIPSEYVGDWYQKDKQTKITKNSVQLGADPNHVITKDSKPMPLDVHIQNGFQYFWQGALMDMDGTYQWKKDGDEMPFWVAKMTIDGKKQNVLASIHTGFITVWTQKPTSKDYSFDLPANVKIPSKPITDLDKYAKNGTSKEDIDKQSDSDNGLSQAEAQKLVPGAINKYLDKSMSFEPVGSYSDATGWSFKINDDLTLHVIPDDSNSIRFEFYNTSSDDQHIEGTVTYNKKSGKYLSPADSSESSDSDDSNSDNSSDNNKHNSDDND